MNASELDTVEKLREVFKHLDVVVTTDLDLKSIHNKIKDANDEEMTYFKSIILLDENNFADLKEIISNKPVQKTARSNEESKKVTSKEINDEHESFYRELEVYGGLERTKIDEIYQGKEDLSIKEKIKMFTSLNNKENKKDKKEDNAEMENNVLLDSLTQNTNILSNISGLSESSAQNYQSQSSTNVSKGELFSKAYNVSKKDLKGELRSTMTSYHNQLCRKTLSSFFDQLPLEDLLKILSSNNENVDMFIKYIQIRGNEAANIKHTSKNKEQFENFLALVKNILQISAKNEKYTTVIDTLLHEVIIQGTANILKVAATNKIKEVWNDKRITDNALNIMLIPEIVKYLASEAKEKVYAKETFIKLITVLLLLPITFREEKETHQNLYMCVFNLILPYVQNPKEYNDPDTIKALLNHEFMNKIFNNLPKTIDYSSTNLSNEQKILFEIMLATRKIDEMYPDISCMYACPDCILDLERSTKVLKEMKKFDMVSYLVYYKKELSDSEKEQNDVIETAHSMYKNKFSSQHEYEEVKRLTIQIDPETKLEGDAAIAITRDREGHSIIKLIRQSDIDSSDSTISINAKKFYMHYPFNPPRVSAFGYGYNCKLGNDDHYGTTEKPFIMKNLSIPLKKLCSRYNYTLALSEDNKLYRTGYKNEWGTNYNTIEEYKGEYPEEKIIDISCGYNNYAALTENHKIYIQGYDTGFHLDSNSTKNNLWHKERPDEDTEKVAEWDVGYDFHIYVTDNGKAYGAGNEFMKGIKLESTDAKYIRIPFDEGVVPIKPLCSNNPENYRTALMFVDVDGQGKNKDSSDKFAPLDYDTEKITFVKAGIYYYVSMAVTDKGELYGWGNNGYGTLGMNDASTFCSPTEIPFFKDYVVHDFKVGYNMVMICASPKTKPDERQYFLTGDKKGLPTDDSNNDGVLHMKQFDNCNHKWMEMGEEVAFIGFDGENTCSEGVSVHKEYTCEVTGESPIQGTMHFWNTGEKDWHYVSEKGYKQVINEEYKLEIPPIVYATKAYIKDIPEKKWPEIKEKDLLEDNSHKDGPIYTANNACGETKIIPIPKSNDNSIFEPEKHDVNPLIFFRMTRPLRKDANLPVLSLDDYFEKAEALKLKVKVEPDYLYQKSQKMINIQKEKFKRTVASIQKFPEKYDNELLESIEANINKNAIDFFNNPSTEINASDCEFTTKELKVKQAKEVQPRINAFLSFNENFAKVIPFVILDEEMIKEVTGGKSQVKADTLSVLFMTCKSIAFRCTKNSYIKKIADGLPTNNDEPEINYNRMLTMHKKDKGKVDNKGEWSIFGTTMQKVKEKNYESLRVSNSSTKAWRANFIGEGSIDAGGPFRETISMITDELYSNSLPLLIPTQNHKNNHGLGRDLWTINPSTTSPCHLEMYKFLGALMGMAFRAGHVMNLKFPSIFWKKFVSEPITIEDLHYSDAYAVQAINDAEKSLEYSGSDMYGEMMDLNFTTQLSNGETVPICDDGIAKKITKENFKEYSQLVIDTRANEGIKQMQAMRDGFDIIFPISILAILSWRDVEERVRGPSEISIDALKSITEYSSCSSDNEYAKRFWKVLGEFTNDEKSLFLKFVWGRARLPPAERLKEQPFKLVLMEDYRFTDHDIHFPEAHTCFFQLDLPRYTNDESCKAKLLYAIEACGEIDTDNSSYSIADAGGQYSDGDSDSDSD